MAPAARNPGTAARTTRLRRAPARPSQAETAIPRAKTAVDRDPTPPDSPEAETHAPLGRVLSAAQFWDVMGRWSVSDQTALALIAYPGKLGKSGKRPRFRFTTHQQRITSYLPAIDEALGSAGKEHGWLHRKARGKPFNGRTPVEHMVAGGLDGLADVLRSLNRTALRAALRRGLGAEHGADEEG